MSRRKCRTWCRKSAGRTWKHLLALALADEQDLNNREPGKVFDTTVKWMKDAQANPLYKNVILYVNSWGSQLQDKTLDDFITQAKPDMISFDTYPWVTDPIPGGSPADWYTWMRRYRVYADAHGIPFGVYRQTYHSDSEKRRDPSPSEQNLSTFAPLAFGSLWLADFTYNTGASSMFGRLRPDQGAGDTLPKPSYNRQAKLNMQARRLGKALVRLKQVEDQSGKTYPNQGVSTRSRTRRAL